MIRSLSILIVIAISLPTVSKCQVNNYALLPVADSLKQNADQVIRYYGQDIDIVRSDLVQISEHKVYTVLNKEGESPFEYYYDKRHEVGLIDIVIYDAKGKQVEKLTKRSFRDFPASGKDEVTDGRVLLANFTYPSYPYTVDVTVKRENKETFRLPNFLPIKKAKVSLEKANFHLAKPKDFLVKWKADEETKSNLIVHPNEMEFSYELRNVRAKKIYDRTHSSYILFTASDFFYEGYEGKGSDWNGMAQFIYALNKTQQVVPAGLRNELQSMTKDISDVKEKIRIVYQYVQDNYRYVSVQLGIGGFQPKPVETVYNNKFGDCKGLSNLMVSSLQAVGIPAFYTLALVDEQGALFPDFAYNYFNHAIAGVPTGQDTIWLECTSGLLPPNIMSSNMNPFVLVVQNAGGSLVKVTNRIVDSSRCSISGTLSVEGKIMASVSVKYYGHAFVRPLNFYTDDREQERFFINRYFPDALIDSFSFSYKKHGRAYPVEETFSMQRQCEFGSKRIFLSMMGFLSVAELKRNIEALTNDYYRYDSTVLLLEDALSNIENNPFENTVINSAFGNYTCNVFKEDKKLILVRKLVIPTYKKNAVNVIAIEKFLNEILVLENEKIIIAP